MTVPDRPVAGADIETVWGQEVHDRVFASKGYSCSGTGVSINDASDQLLPIDTALDDPGGWVSVASNNAVAPAGAGGIYLLIAEFGATGGAADSETRGSIYLNGVKLISALEQNEGGVAAAWTAVTVAEIAAGDVIFYTARLRHDSGANPTVNLTNGQVIFLTDVRGA